MHPKQTSVVTILISNKEDLSCLFFGLVHKWNHTGCALECLTSIQCYVKFIHTVKWACRPFNLIFMWLYAIFIYLFIPPIMSLFIRGSVCLYRKTLSIIRFIISAGYLKGSKGSWENVIKWYVCFGERKIWDPWIVFL